VRGTGGDSGRELRVEMRDGYAVVLEDGAACVTVPELIWLMHTEAGQPVATEDLRVGMSVAAMTAPAPAPWRTPAGLALTGPRSQGYDVDPVLLAPQEGRAL
jgi:DUF917 family protein